MVLFILSDSNTQAWACFVSSVQLARPPFLTHASSFGVQCKSLLLSKLISSS